MPINIQQALDELAATFQLVAGGPLPKVVFLGANKQGRFVLLVGYLGDELVRCMQIEAFLVEKGEVITQRSKCIGGRTVLLYSMQGR